MRYYITMVKGFVVFCLMACNKHDNCPEPPQTSDTCSLTQSFVKYQTANPYSRSQYRKEYDANGQITKVEAGRFDYGLKSSRVFFLKYSGNTVYFTNESGSDTALIAFFDGAGRLTKIIAGNAPAADFYGTEYTYASNRLTHIQSLIDPRFTVTTGFDTQYDAKGNIAKLSSSSACCGDEFNYVYDTTVTASTQFYSDDFILFEFNTFYVAQFLGWLPDLMPVNKRIRTYSQAFDYNVTNHVYDGEGRLVSYDGGFTVEGVPLQFTNTWTCGLKKKIPN